MSRSVVGWPRVAAAKPNAAHVALADLEQRGRVVGVITQNVDSLHQRAGSRRVVEIANKGGKDHFERDPHGAWARLVEIYEEIIRSHCPPS